MQIKRTRYAPIAEAVFKLTTINVLHAKNQSMQAMTSSHLKASNNKIFIFFYLLYLLKLLLRLKQNNLKRNKSSFPSKMKGQSLFL